MLSMGMPGAGASLRELTHHGGPQVTVVLQFCWEGIGSLKTILENSQQVLSKTGTGHHIGYWHPVQSFTRRLC